MPNEYDVSTQVTLAVTIKTNRKLRVTDFEEIIQEMALRTWEAVLDEDDGTRVAVELQDFGTDGVTIKPHAPGTIAPFEHC